MKRLRDLLGAENNLDTVSRTLCDVARSQHAAGVGAMHVTCSDECERECAESFQQWFTQNMLPELKFWSKSPFRTATIGGRYEWGEIPTAEEHYATPASRDAFKLLVVKINAHVCVTEQGGQMHFGRMERYGTESNFCGGIHAMLEGAQQPAISDLREAFASEGVDRIAMLLDPDKIEPRLRSLAAAATGARLQARRAVLDIQSYRPTTPTLHLVVACVTINRHQRDTELVVGMYTADSRDAQGTVKYQGLGDDPSRYRISLQQGRLRIEDDHLHEERLGRDHRREVQRLWQPSQSHRMPPPEQLTRLAQVIARNKHGDAAVAREVLKSLVSILTTVSPIPTAILLFVDAFVGIHNVYRAYRLAHSGGENADAKAILDQFLARADSLSAEQAQAVIDRLVGHFGITAAEA